MKTSYAQLQIEVDKLFNKYLKEPETSLEDLEDHCELIVSYIEANGWNIDDYLKAYLSGSENQSN